MKRKPERTRAAYAKSVQDISDDAYFYEDEKGIAVHIWEQISGVEELFHVVVPWNLLIEAVNRHKRVAADRPDLRKQLPAKPARKSRGL